MSEIFEKVSEKVSYMSYCPSSTSLTRSDFLPGISSIPDGRRTSSGRSCVTSSMESIPGIHHNPHFDNNPWNVIEVHGPAPETRCGQTIMYWPEGNAIICAYGRNKDDSFTDEFWKFSIETNNWEKLEVKDVTPRAAAGCALVNSKLYFFGGITTSNFVRDYHIVDLNTLEVEYPVTTGDAPPECALPLVAFWNKYLIVWAGTSGSNLSCLHILDTEENHWQEIKTDFVGRQGACGCIIDTTLYIYGASCPMSILALNLETWEFTAISTTGTAPPHGTECLTMITSGNTILAFETNCASPTARIYIYDIERSNWISNTINITTENPESPRIVFYLPYERKLLALGENSNGETHPLAELSIGKMISNLNQRIDMLAALRGLI